MEKWEKKWKNNYNVYIINFKLLKHRKERKYMGEWKINLLGKLIYFTFLKFFILTIFYKHKIKK